MRLNYIMPIIPIRKDIDLVREPLYASRQVESKADVNNQKREGNSYRGEIVRSAISGKKDSLVSGDASGVKGRQALVPANEPYTQRDGNTIFLNKEIRPEDTNRINRDFFYFNLNTEVLKDQYAIEKVVFDSSYQSINKYRKVQAYRSSSDSILEVFA